MFKSIMSVVKSSCNVMVQEAKTGIDNKIVDMVVNSKDVCPCMASYVFTSTEEMYQVLALVPATKLYKRINKVEVKAHKVNTESLVLNAINARLALR